MEVEQGLLSEELRAHVLLRACFRCVRACVCLCVRCVCTKLRVCRAHLEQSARIFACDVRPLTNLHVHMRTHANIPGTQKAQDQAHDQVQEL